MVERSGRDGDGDRKEHAVSFKLDSESVRLLDEAIRAHDGEEELSRGQMARLLFLRALHNHPGALRPESTPAPNYKDEFASLEEKLSALSRQMLELGSAVDQVTGFVRGSAKSAELLSDTMVSVGRQLLSVEEKLDRVSDDTSDLLGAVAEVLIESPER